MKDWYIPCPNIILENLISGGNAYLVLESTSPGLFITSLTSHSFLPKMFLKMILIQLVGQEDFHMERFMQCQNIFIFFFNSKAKQWSN